MFIMNVRTRFRIVILTFCIVIICCISDNNFIDPFDNQPKIIIKDGHLEFKTAKNRNIAFKSSGDGSISINGEDLSKVVEMGKTLSVEMQRISSAQLADISRNLSLLQTQYTNLANNVFEMRTLQALFNDSSNKINQMLGTGTNAMQPNTVRRSLRRIQTIRTRLDRISQLLEKNECESNPCRNGGTCIDAYNSYTCKCTDYWEGVTCESDVNECARFMGTELGCQNGATCVNTVGSYSCRCPPHRYGVHCTEQYDDCSLVANDALCVHGTCISLTRTVADQPKYRCICSQGWTTSGNSPACDQDVDECTSTSAHCSVNPPVMCINIPGDFRCGPCPHGYSGNGFTCYDVNECETNNGGCSQFPRVQCTNTIGSRICGPCPAGYQGNGIVCNFVGMCHINNGGCHPMAQCFENSAISTSFRECRCPNGYMGSGIGASGCVAQSGTTCANNPCVHGSCLPNGDSFTCVCNTGFTGRLCDMEVNECLSNPCLNGGTCTDQQNGFLCVCGSDYQGLRCEQQRETCGGTLNAAVGSLTFPSNRNVHYPNQVSCTWLIETAVGKVLNMTFSSFTVESTADCSYDFLQINDGPNENAHRIGRFCGNSLPNGGNIVSTHHNIYLWFKSDHSVTNEGFQLQWNTTDPVCGAQLNTVDFGSVYSPGYPAHYPNHRECYWLVSVPLGKRIIFHFATLSIETHENCNYDYLEVFDGQRDRDPVLGKYCSTTTPTPLTTSGSYALIHFHSDESLNDVGFHITYSSVPGIPGCGGTLTSAKGSFSSPNFPERYDNNIECDWLIRTHPNERLQISFTLFDLESHSSCEFDYLEFRDGDNGESPLLGRFCGSSIPASIISNGNKLWVKFRADQSLTGQGFRALYETVCGGLFTDLSGTLRSPYFPDAYPSERKCLYHIVVPQSNLVQLQFDFFDIEGSIDCDYDYLEVRDSNENGTRLGHLCGTAIPDMITSRYNELWLKFVTDSSVNNLGFSANYSSIEVGCGGVYTTNHGSIATPNHPSFYPNAAQCFFLLRAPIGYVIRLTFIAFALEPHSSCRYDYVEVRDSDYTFIRKFCGNAIPPVLTSTGNQMFVAFKSDSSRAQEGFAAAFSFLDASTSCGGNFYTQSGTIRSPGYPNSNYPSQRDCVWNLQVNNGQQIRLNVTHFELEGGSDCRYDYLEIRNGREVNSPLVGKFCGTRIVQKIVSHSNVMYLRFKTDGSGSYPGFEISYDSAMTGCGGTLTSQSGSLESPGYPQPYGHNAQCFWKIMVSKGSVIHLNMIDVDIEAQSKCLFDYLEIFDGNSDQSPSLGRYCNTRANSHFITSKTNVLFVKFRSDHSLNGRGFRLNYQINCTNTITGYRGVIESPNYPDNYGHNANCTWSVVAPRGNNITIAFHALYIEEATNCRYDYLQVFDTIEGTSDLRRLAKYCGTSNNQIPVPFNTSSNTAVINFVSDHSISHMGFQLEWSTVGCGGEFTYKNYGEFTSPNYPNGYPHNTECLWHIIMTPGVSIILTVEDFDLEGDQGCSFDYVEVFGGPDVTSPKLTTLCHKIDSPKTFKSMGSAMTIKFSSDSSVIGRGFRATFRQTIGVCGGQYTLDSYTLTSPNYPAKYDSSDDCQYLIEISGLYNIEFRFDDFEMPQSVNCSENYLAIYDGPSEDNPLLIKHCGETIPNPNIIQSTSNQVYMRMKADGNSFGKGFKLFYKSICGGRKVVNSNEMGEIKSPNYPSHPLNADFCHWILIASDLQEHITLTFTHIETQKLDECTAYYVEVLDGDDSEAPVINRYCGTRIPMPITSQGNALYISSKEAVFRATFSTSTSICGGELISEEGIFASPDYPNTYPLDIECVWIIRASPGNRVTFNFISFNIEQSEFCNTDYIELREMSATGPYLGRYCGVEVPILNFTSSNALWVKFRTDDQSTASGFQAHYALEHGIELSGNYGRITSPGYPFDFKYGRETDAFTWKIIVQSSMFVSITFEELSIQSYSYEECTSYVQIIDGIDETAPAIGKYCGYLRPDPIVGTSNALSVKFVPQYSSGKFSLIWAAINETQAANYHFDRYNANIDRQSNTSFEISLNRSDSYRIISPGYPTGYANNLDYNWTIHTLRSYHLSVNVVDLFLDGHNWSCNYDYYDKLRFLVPEHHNSALWVLNRTLCGRFVGSFQLPPTNLIRINFKTDSYYNTTGFNLTVTPVCGGTLYNTSGILSTDDVVNSFHCEWIIIVREGRTVKLTFEMFNIADNNHCQNSYMILKNGRSNTSPYLGGGRYCGTNIPVVPESASNSIYIIFHADYNLHADFRLKYEEISIGCGDYLILSATNPSVEIMSPNYPQLPPHDMECDWLIRGPLDSTLRLEFEMTPDPSWRCNKSIEYVEVRDGGTQISRLIDRYCLPPRGVGSIITSGNLMFVRFVTIGNEYLSFFKAKVDINDCGATYFVSYYYQLTLPNYPNNYMPNMNCKFFIKTYSENYYYRINITSLDMPTDSEDCHAGDSIELREQDSTGDLIGHYCGTSTNNTISIDSKRSTVMVTFKSNGDPHTGKGFVIDIYAIYSRCGGLIRNAETGGEIMSPNFPNALFGYRYCYWLISATPGRSIKITFQDYNLKSNPRNTSLCLDALSAYKGPSGRSTKVALQCNDIIPNPIEIQSHVMNIIFTTWGLASNEGFRLEYSADNEEVCGGSLDGDYGVIMSYRFGETNYTETVDCIWDIDLRSNNRNNLTVAMVFDVFEIPKSGQFCDNSVFTISYFNSRYLQNYLYDICGNMTANGRVYDVVFLQTDDTSYHITAALHTNYSNGYRGISGYYYVRECGGIYSNPEADFESPNYPLNYPQNSICVWQFSVEWGELIRISFTDFDLGSDCDRDYIEIFQGWSNQSPSSGKFCHNRKPTDIHSSSRYLRVEFKGMSSMPRSSVYKFKMNVRKAQHGCGGLLFHHFGSFESNNYPNRYENNIECVWIIQMPVGYHVNFTFVDTFDIETQTNCANDYLLFEEQLIPEQENSWREMSKLCGHVNPGALKSRSNVVRVTFRTNDAIQGNGFRISYQKACGELLTADSGVFTSPNYPNAYDNYVKCEYLIQRQASDYIYLSFDDDFLIENHTTCIWDALDIYLGNNRSAPHMGPYCGNNKPLPITSNAAILVTFISDSYITTKGFKAYYNMTSCGGDLSAPEGEIHSPLHPTRYMHNMDCIWTITVADNRVVELSFIWIEMENCYQCACDYVEVRDGNNGSANSLGRFCSSTRLDMPTIKSQANQLWVRFRSDGSIARTGFQMAYRTTIGELQGCGGVYNNQTNGVIQSPDIDGDGNYELDIDCHWIIIVPFDQTIKLTFQEINIEESASNLTKCSYDYLEIYDGFSTQNSLIDRYCGTVLPTPVIGSVNKMTLLFHSDGREARKGFRVTFESVNSICGELLNVTNVTQSIRSINYPNSYPVSLRCRWEFVMRRQWQNRIHLSFQDLDIDCSNNDSIIFTVDSYEYRRLEPFRMCGKTPPPLVMSDTGLKMTFVTSNTQSANHRGFVLNYTISNCNQTYTFDSGYFHNTIYPYFSYEFCQINITANADHTIALYFDYFNFNQYNPRQINMNSCERSNMTVRDGFNSDSPVIATLCGTTLPDPIFSNSNHLSINISSSNYYYYKYFISYTSTNAGRGCGGNLTAFNATFTSPLYPMPYNKSGECKWFVHSLGLHTLTLRFLFFSLSSTIGCDDNYLEIYEGLEDIPSNKVMRLCGDDEPAPYQSQGNVLLVKLVTNANNTASGFKAHYSFNTNEINPTKQILTSSLGPHISRDNSYYYQTGVLFRSDDQY